MNGGGCCWALGNFMATGDIRVLREAADGSFAEHILKVGAQLVFAARYGDDPLDVYNDGMDDLGTLVVTDTNQHSAVPYNKIDVDPTSGWNAAAKTFTMPEDGLYLVAPFTVLGNLPEQAFFWATIHVNGEPFGIDVKSYTDPIASSGGQTAGYGGMAAINAPLVRAFAAGDAVKVAVYTGNGGVFIRGSFYPVAADNESYVSIVKL